MKKSELVDHTVQIDIGRQPLESKLSAAVHIATMGVETVGIKTKAVLMWPCREFSDAEVRKEAATLLDHLLSLQLTALPPQVIDQIQQDQEKRLTLVS